MTMTNNPFKKVIVIGLGGTGSYLASPLCRYLYSINFKGEIIFADGDFYELSNSERQQFDIEGVGKNKAAYHAESVIAQIPGYEQNITYCDEYVNKDDVGMVVEEGTLVITCVDNAALRKYVEDRVLSLNNACHICCGNDLRHGQVQVSLRRDNELVTPTIYTQSPGFDDDSDDRSKMTCQEISELPGGGQIIAANMMAASLALNYVIQVFGEYPINNKGRFIRAGFTGFDILNNTFENRNIRDPFTLKLSAL